MPDHHIHQEQIIPEARDTVFAFFSRPENLQDLTPPWLSFRIDSPLPILMEPGTHIRYRLRIKGVPVTWVSRITVWDPPHRFTDEQIRGPYRRWIHTHEFEEVDGGTLVRDRVRYAVPGGWLVHRLLVRPDVEKIFRYRKDRLRARFGDAVSREDGNRGPTG